MPRQMPRMPPITDSVTDSIKNCRRMLTLLAPTAMRMPISRVRSVTETSMMFMMPMPPTTSEMTAMEASSMEVTLVVLRRASSICERLRTAKSSVSPPRILWRSRSSIVISLVMYESDSIDTPLT